MDKNQEFHWKILEPLELNVFYDGQEQDKYLTSFGALSADYQVNDDLILTTTISTFNTQEEEYFDIAASYNLGEVDSNIGLRENGEVGAEIHPSFLNQSS